MLIKLIKVGLQKTSTVVSLVKHTSFERLGQFKISIAVTKYNIIEIFMTLIRTIQY